ncbi:hypothetical protein, partial [Yersinia rohdei]|uniref:hypothetical protein n=1 Tax=Yersinia rohdei TaxID=29485 RepID=UPI000518EF4D
FIQQNHVQFTDATEAVINGYFCYPQDPQYYNFLGESEVGDARYLTFYEKKPDYAKAILRIPDE